MDLADFIEANIPALVDDWAEYAVGISQDESQLSEDQLRNSAADILTAIATDMREPQSAMQQQSKSRGENHAPQSRFNQVARLHAEDRLSHAFGINDVVAEFRALRATVLRRWQVTVTSPAGASAFQQMIRFSTRPLTRCLQNRYGTMLSARNASGISLREYLRTISGRRLARY